MEWNDGMMNDEGVNNRKFATELKVADITPRTTPPSFFCTSLAFKPRYSNVKGSIKSVSRSFVGVMEKNNKNLNQSKCHSLPLTFENFV